MSIEKIFEAVERKQATLKKEDLGGALLTTEQMKAAMKAVGIVFPSSVQLKRLKQKQSANVQTEYYEADITTLLPPVLAAFFSKMVFEAEANFFLKENAYSVRFGADWNHVGGGRNGIGSMGAPVAISMDAGQTWKKQ